jgi:uncharacterized protein (TIGR03435 family)
LTFQLFVLYVALCFQFEVATVKRSPPPTGDRINMNLGNIRNGKLTLENATLSDCLKFAYGLNSDAQLSGPAWIGSKEFLFDVVAVTPQGSTREQNLANLQKLLTERLKIASHHESREMSYLALVVAKGGPKLKPAAADPAPSGPSMAGKVINHQMTMRTLSLLLSRFEKQTVLEMTGLEGAYEVSLTWVPDGSAADDDRPTLYTALPQQLGLKLEPRKGPVDVLVIDSAEKIPAEN